MDQTDTLKAVGALLLPVKHAAIGAHLGQQFILLADEQIFLDLGYVPLRVHVIDLWKNFRDIGIVFLESILIQDPAISVGYEREGQAAILK